MDDILQEIARVRSGQTLMIPLARFVGQARRYLDLGVFKRTNERYREVSCPNGCGEDVFVEGRVGNGYVVTCEHRGIPEEIVIPPEQIELCEFDEVAFKELVKQGKIKPDACGKASKKSPRKGSGLRGKRTRAMSQQLDDFKTFLLSNPISEIGQGKTAGARAKQFWANHQKEFEKAAKASGERRGYPSAKAIASAYRTSRA